MHIPKTLQSQPDESHIRILPVTLATSYTNLYSDFHDYSRNFILQQITEPIDK